MRLKNTPMDSTMAEFWNVAAIPLPTPRWSAGTLFMTWARFGEANRPIELAKGEHKRRTNRRRSQRAALRGMKKLAADNTIPPEAKGLGPNRSERKPGDRPGHEEAGRQRHHVDARPQRRGRLNA